MSWVGLESVQLKVTMIWHLIDILTVSVKKTARNAFLRYDFTLGRVKRYVVCSSRILMRNTFFTFDFALLFLIQKWLTVDNSWGTFVGCGCDGWNMIVTLQQWQGLWWWSYPIVKSKDALNICPAQWWFALLVKIEVKGRQPNHGVRTKGSFGQFPKLLQQPLLSPCHLLTTRGDFPKKTCTSSLNMKWNLPFV